MIKTIILLGISYCGIMDIEDEETLYIEIPEEKTYTFIKSSKLMHRTKKENEFIPIRGMEKYTRSMKSKDEYKEYKKMIREMVEDEDSEVENKIREFNEVYVSLKAIKKDSTVTYSISLKLEDIDGELFDHYSRSFYYCSKDKRWKIGEAEDKDAFKYWPYIMAGCVGVLFLGFAVYMFA